LKITSYAFSATWSSARQAIAARGMASSFCANRKKAAAGGRGFQYKASFDRSFSTVARSWSLDGDEAGGSLISVREPREPGRERIQVIRLSASSCLAID